MPQGYRLRTCERALEIAVQRQPSHLGAVPVDGLNLPLRIRYVGVGRRQRVGEQWVSALHPCVQDAHRGGTRRGCLEAFAQFGDPFGLFKSREARQQVGDVVGAAKLG